MSLSSPSSDNSSYTPNQQNNWLGSAMNGFGANGVPASRGVSNYQPPPQIATYEPPVPSQPSPAAPPPSTPVPPVANDPGPSSGVPIPPTMFDPGPGMQPTGSPAAPSAPPSPISPSDQSLLNTIRGGQPAPPSAPMMPGLGQGSEIYPSAFWAGGSRGYR